nr:hypothetical protein LR48_Vigan11g128000 [Ipomoea batatas]
MKLQLSEKMRGCKRIVPNAISTQHVRGKNLVFFCHGGGNQILVEELENSGADGGELGLNLGSVVLNEDDMVVVLAALLFLLNRRNYPPSRPERADNVLVGNREKVALLHGELEGRGSRADHQAVHELHHLLVPLRLLR